MSLTRRHLLGAAGAGLAGAGLTLAGCEGGIPKLAGPPPARPRIPTTQTYIHADLALNQQALNRTKPTTTPAGRCRPAADHLLEYLEGL